MGNIQLSLVIKNNKPIDLNILTKSLNAFAREYDSYCKEKLNLPSSDRQLELKGVENGVLRGRMKSLC